MVDRMDIGKYGSPCLWFEHLDIMPKVDVGQVLNDHVKAPNVVHLRAKQCKLRFCDQNIGILENRKKDWVG